MQVKNEVQPIQESEAARIKSEVAVFSRRVTDFQKGFRTRSFYKYATGAERAYPEVDQASCSSCCCCLLERPNPLQGHSASSRILRHARWR